MNARPDFIHRHATPPLHRLIIGSTSTSGSSTWHEQSLPESPALTPHVSTLPGKLPPPLPRGLRADKPTILDSMIHREAAIADCTRHMMAMRPFSPTLEEENFAPSSITPIPDCPSPILPRYSEFVDEPHMQRSARPTNLDSYRASVIYVSSTLTVSSVTSVPFSSFSGRPRSTSSATSWSSHPTDQTLVDESEGGPVTMAHRIFDVKPNFIEPLARPKARNKQGEDRSRDSSTLGSSTAADSPGGSYTKFKRSISLPKIVADLLSTKPRLSTPPSSQPAKKETWRQVLYHGKAISKPRPYHYSSPGFAHGNKPPPLHRGMGVRRESSLSEARRRNRKDESDTVSIVAWSPHTDTTVIEGDQQERDWQYWQEQEYRQQEDGCWWGGDEEVEECTIPIYAIGDPSGSWHLANYDKATFIEESAENQRSTEFWF